MHVRGYPQRAVKVLSVVGNRPQFVKSAPLSVALRETGIDEIVLHTGQHWDRELSQVFFDELDLPEPRYRLGLHTRDVDAGLRSFDLTMPEEHNRIAVDRIAALLFPPDERASRQLEVEGVAGRREV